MGDAGQSGPSRRGERQFDVVGFGEPMVEFSQLPGRTDHYLHGFGGDTMNAVIAARRQGARVAYFTRLGDDEFGRQVRELLARERVDDRFVATDADAPTAVYFVTHGPAGHVFSYRRAGSAASRMRPTDVTPACLEEARFFHTSGITQAISASACDAVFAAIELAKALSVKVAYDSNLRLKLWPLARAAVALLATPNLDRVKECANHASCGWLFLDQSKNGSRRWCSMDDCGSRDKMRRQYARRRDTR